MTFRCMPLLSPVEDSTVPGYMGNFLLAELRVWPGHGITTLVPDKTDLRF